MSTVIEDRVKETTTVVGTGNAALGGAQTGFRAFSSVMVDNDNTTYCIVGGSEWEVGIGTFLTASGIMRNGGVLSSSNSGALVSFSSGTKDIFITSSADRFMLPQYTTDPAVPQSGNWLYSRKLGGRWVPRFLGPSGVDTAIQPALFANNVTMWLPGTGATAPINFGVSFTTATTQATPAIANTNFMTQMKRATFTTTTTASNNTGPRSSAPICWRGSVAGQGGFFFAARFGILTFSSTMRIWCGLSALTGALTAATDPSAITDTCGMIKDTADAQWNLLTRAGAATKQPTGITCAAATASGIFDFFMFAKPNDTQIGFRVVDVATGVVYVDNYSATLNLPANTSMLTIHCEAQNQAGGAGSAVAIFLNKIYVESDT